MSAAEDSFKIGDQQFNTGSFIIKTEGNPGDLARAAASQAATELGTEGSRRRQTSGSEDARSGGAANRDCSHLDQHAERRLVSGSSLTGLRIPYTYISDHMIRDTPNLREKFDVMIFPPVGGSAQTIVNGMPKRGEPDSVEETRT